jgi:[NiFe] hydrogenase assembly HybE family chaperone
MTDAATGTTMLPDPSARLEAAFRDIETRMNGLPFINPRLGIEAVAFAPWKHYWLGAMVTPWSMNLMLLAGDPTAWRSLTPGEKRRYVFPAGNYDFVSAHDLAIGEYFVCSLFSPVLEFADHATAVETARLARAALFDVAQAEAAEGERAPQPTQASEPGPLTQITASLHAPLSRRDLFHGRFGGGDR